MKVFLDANVLISVLNKEYPLFTFSARVLSLANRPNITLYTSPLCLAIAFYYAEKKSGNALALRKIKLLASQITCTSIAQKTVEAVVGNRKVHDFEDGLQYYSAVESGCKCIVTEDSKGFYYSEIEVLNCRQFLERHIF